MDAVSAVLDGHRARGAFLLRSVMQPPWGVRIADRAAVAVLIMLRGRLSLTRAAHPPLPLTPGDVAIIKGADPYVLADAPGRAPSVVVEPGQVCRPVPEAMGPQPRQRTIELGADGVWGNDPDGSCAFVVGIYELPGQVSGRLLHAIPDLVVVAAERTEGAITALLVDEFACREIGQAVVLDRLVDLVLITGLRSWLTGAGADAPAWWQARHDPVVGVVLTLVHDQPDQPWTLASLARRAGVSRATLARRCTQLLGQSPMAYLAEWRMRSAADLLTTGSESVEQVARQVGYANPFAFSTAFKRHHGISPRGYRDAATREVPEPRATVG